MDWRELLDWMEPEEARTLLDERGAHAYAQALRAAGMPSAGAFRDPGCLDVLAALLPGLVGTPEEVMEGEQPAPKALDHDVGHLQVGRVAFPEAHDSLGRSQRQPLGGPNPRSVARRPF